MPGHGAPSGTGHDPGPSAATVRGLSASTDGLTLELDRTPISRGVTTDVAFRIRDRFGVAVRDFEVEHDKRMHLIVVRRDLTGFQHLHPTMAGSGTWHAGLTPPEAGSYRVFADFKHDGRNVTLARNSPSAARSSRSLCHRRRPPRPPRAATSSASTPAPQQRAASRC